MKNATKRTSSIILLVCVLAAMLVPSVVPRAEANSQIVYDFHASYIGAGYTHSYHSGANTVAEAEDAIAAAFAAGTSNWRMETHTGYANLANRYTRIYISANSAACIVMRMKAPATGTYTVNFNYHTASYTAAALSSNVYIIPATEEAYTQVTIGQEILGKQPLANINFYDASAAYVAKTATGEYSFVAGNEYLFVIQSSSNTTGSGTSQMFINNLTLDWKSEYTPPVEHGTPLPVIADEMPVKMWKDGVCGAITQVNGRDYLALPIYGEKMYVYDLDSWTLISEVQTGIPTPRGATVDDDGNIWVTGDAQHLYKYNPYNHVGEQTSNFTGTGGVVSSGSAFAITQGDDGNLYFGTYPNGGIVKYDPVAQQFTKIAHQEPDIKYATAVLQKGNYIYASMHDTTTDYLVKLDAQTYETVAKLDISVPMGTQRYLAGLNMIGEDIIVGNSTGYLLAVNIHTMQLLTAEEFGLNAAIKGNVSEVRDNKVYFTTYSHGVCVYDLTLGKASQLTGGLTGGTLPLRCNAGNFVTLNHPDLPGESLLAYSISNICFNAYNLQTNKIVALRDLVDSNAGSGVGVRALTPGLPGSNELYIGAFSTNETYVYNTQSATVTHSLTGAGMQTDAMHWYNNVLYVGNYTLGQLTALDPVDNTPTAMFMLNDAVFDQARIHTITSGDNKIFVGSVPDVYKKGGMIAWYDFTLNRAYAAVGPNPGDVYWADTSVENYTWYNEVTGEARTADILDDTGIPGVISKQSINTLVYHDGLLYGTSSTQGGTSAGILSGASAVIFVYDVENRQVIATCDLSEIGITRAEFVAGIAADPNVATNGKFWGVVSETLFSFTFNTESKTFAVTEELSFSKTEYRAHGSRYLFPLPILFDDGYIYVCFGTNGNLCKIDMTNPQVFEQLLPDTDDITELPQFYVLGEDGCLYYLLDTTLYMLTLNPTDAEWEAAEAVDAMIDNLGAITAASSQSVREIRIAYNALTMRQKSLVQGYASFMATEVELMIARIQSIGTVTSESAALLTELRADYNNFTYDQKQGVTNYATLILAEIALANLQAAE